MNTKKSKSAKSSSTKSASKAAKSPSKAAPKKAATAAKPSTSASSVALATPAPATPAPQPAAPATKMAVAVVIAQVMAQISAIETSLGLSPPLPPADKKHMTRMRKGGEPVAAEIGSLVQRYGMETPTLQVAPMMDALETAAAYAPLLSCVSSFAQHIEDTIFAAQSSAWSDALKGYAVLKPLAKSDSTLATALSDVKEFMAYRHPTPKAPGQPTKPQQRALKKSVAGVKKLAPQLLVSGPQAPVPASPAPQATVAAPAPQPPAGGSNGSNGSSQSS